MVLKIAHPIITKDKRLNNGVPCITIKLDMAKTYDKMNQEFIYKALSCLTFPKKI